MNKKEYNYIDSIANYCKQQNINLTIVQSPYRTGYLRNATINDLNAIKNHITNVKSRCNKHDITFVDPSNKEWPDSYFIDWIHLNKQGAHAFANYCISEIDKKDEMKK